MLVRLASLIGSMTAVVILAGLATGQSNETGFRGEVVNYDNGAVIVNAKISVTQKSRTWTATSDDTGNYDLNLSPGVYDLMIEALGFTTVRRKKIKLVGKGLFTFNVNMKNNGLVVDAKHP